MFENILHLYNNTDPIDREAAATAMKEFYEYCGQDEPEIVFVDGPEDFKAKFDPKLEGFSFFDHQDIAHFVTKRGRRTYDCLKHDLASVFKVECQPKGMKANFIGSSVWLEAEDYLYKGEYKWEQFATPVWDNSLFTVNYKGRSYMIERPEMVKYNDRGLHCETGPAVRFRDGSEFYFWNSERMTKKQFENPHRITLEEIHSKYNKHIWIAFVGVDHYLQMCKEWEPNVKGKFQKFFDFAKMVLPEDALIKESWNKKGRGWMYEDKPEDKEEWQKHKPYKVEFSKATVNDKHGTLIECTNYNTMYRLPDRYKTHGKHWLDNRMGRKLFEESDRELLDLLCINEQMSNAGFKMEITYLNKEFKLRFPKDERMKQGNCHMHVAPAWFKAKMFLGQDAYYETDKYAVRWSKDKGLEYAGDFGTENFRGYTASSGNEELPWCYFDVELTSDSWEGLLEKWARLAFEWIQMR